MHIPIGILFCSVLFYRENNTSLVLVSFFSTYITCWIGFILMLEPRWKVKKLLDQSVISSSTRCKYEKMVALSWFWKQAYWGTQQGVVNKEGNVLGWDKITSLYIYGRWRTYNFDHISSQTSVKICDNTSEGPCKGLCCSSLGRKLLLLCTRTPTEVSPQEASLETFLTA